MASNSATLRVGANISDFQKATKQMQSEMKMINSEFKVSEAQAKKTGSAMDQLGNQQKSLTDKIVLGGKQIENQKNQIATLNERLDKQKTTQSALATQVDKTNTAYKEAVGTYGKTSTEAKGLKDELTKLEKQQKNNENAIEGTNNQLAKEKTNLNNVTVELLKNEKALGDVNNQIKNFSIEQFSNGLNKVSGQVANVGDTMTRGVTLPIVAGATAAVAAFNEVDAGADIVIQKTGAFGDKGKELEGIYKNVAGNIPADFNAIGGAVGEVNTRFNVMGDELETMSTDFLKFSRVTGVEASEGVRLVSRAMGDAGMETKEYSGLLDLLAKASQSSGIEMATLTGSIAKYGAPMRALGFDTKESIAIFSTWEKAGVNTEIAFSGMKQAIGRWGKEGKDAREEFKKTLKLIEDTPDLAQATTLAIEAFGVEAGPDLADAMQGGRFSIEQMMAVLEESEGTVHNAFDAMQDGGDKAKSAMNKVKIALSEVGADVLESLVPILEQGADALKAFGDWWAGLPQPMQEFIIKALAMVAVTGPLLSGIGRAGQGVSTLVKTFGTAKAGMSLFTGGLKGVSTAAPLAGKALTTVAAGGGSASTVLTTVAGTAKAAGVAMAGAGIGTIALAAAIPATVMGIGYLCEKQWDQANGADVLIAKNRELENESKNFVATVNTEVEARKQSTEAAIGEIQSQENLISTLFNLNNQVGGTTSAKQLMQGTVDQLNGSIDGLNLKINEETGYLNMTKEEILGVVDAKAKQTEAYSAQANMVTNTQQLSEAERLYNQAVTEGNEIEGKRSEIINRVKTEMEASGASQSVIYQQCLNETRSLTVEQRKNEETIKDQAGAVNLLRDEQQQYISTISGEALQAATHVETEIPRKTTNAMFGAEQALKNAAVPYNAAASFVAREGVRGIEQTSPEWQSAGAKAGTAMEMGIGSTGALNAVTANSISMQAANATSGSWSSFLNSGATGGGSFAQGVNGQQGNSNAAGLNIGGQAVAGASMMDMFSVGNNGGGNFVGGINGQTGNSNIAGINLGDAAANGTGSADFYSKGANAGSSFADGITSAISAVQSAWDWVCSQLAPPSISPTVGGGSAGTSAPAQRTSWNWEGGIFTQPTLFSNGVGVGDKYKGKGSNAEAIIPLNTMYQKIDQIVRSSNQKANKTVVEHTGTLRIEGVNDQGQMMDVVNIVMDQLQKEARI